MPKKQQVKRKKYHDSKYSYLAVAVTAISFAFLPETNVFLRGAEALGIGVLSGIATLEVARRL